MIEKANFCNTEIDPMCKNQRCAKSEMYSFLNVSPISNNFRKGFRKSAPFVNRRFLKFDQMLPYPVPIFLFFFYSRSNLHTARMRKKAFRMGTLAMQASVNPPPLPPPRIFPPKLGLNRSDKTVMFKPASKRSAVHEQQKIKEKSPSLT